MNIHFIFLSVSFYFVTMNCLPQIRKCSLSDPNLNKCLTLYANTLLDGVSSNPKSHELFIGHLILSGVSAIYFESDDAAYKEIEIKIEEVRLDSKKKKVSIVSSQNGEFYTSAKISGPVLASGITSKTKFFLKLNDSYIIYEIAYDTRKKSDGKEYARISTHRATVYIGNFKFGHYEIEPEDEPFRNLFNLAVNAITGNIEMIISGWGQEFLEPPTSAFVKIIQETLDTIPLSDIVGP